MLTNPPDRLTAVDPFAEARLGPVTLRNRIIKAATFEGVMPDALVALVACSISPNRSPPARPYSTSPMRLKRSLLDQEG